MNKKTLSDSISIIKKNYNVIADKAIVPEKVKKLGIIDVTNIIYTKKFEKSGYGFKTNGANFEVQIETDTYSYNETNAKSEFVKILSDIGIDKSTYKLSVKKTDIGLVCTAMAVVEPFHIFNASISAVFAPQKINLHGSWYLAEKDVLEENKRSALILSSLMFAFAHANLFQIPYALVAGFIFSSLYLLTGSILPSVILHFLNNAVSLASMYGVKAPVIVIALAITSVASLTVIFIRRKEYKDEIKKMIGKEKAVLTYTPLFFIATSLVIAISMLFV